MPPLFCGGEDIDFPNGGTVGVATAGQYRAGYARCGLYAASNCIRSNAFPGGPVTSFWFRCYLHPAAATGVRVCGVGYSGNAAAYGAGLFVGISTTAFQVRLFKHDGIATQTTLATESGVSLLSATPNKIEMQVINFGALATVNVWVNNNLVITFTGDVTAGGVTQIDQVIIVGPYNILTSEIIISDEDLRAWPGLLTMALTGAGTTDQWSGLFSTINQATISDASPNYSNVNNQDQQFNITDPPVGTFAIAGIRQAARAAKSAASTPTKIALGVNSGGTVAFGGADKALTTAYATYEQMDLVNPVTGQPFTQAEVTALQLDVRSKA